MKTGLCTVNSPKKAQVPKINQQFLTSGGQTDRQAFLWFFWVPVVMKRSIEKKVNPKPETEKTVIFKKKKNQTEF